MAKRLTVTFGILVHDEREAAMVGTLFKQVGNVLAETETAGVCEMKLEEVSEAEVSRFCDAVDAKDHETAKRILLPSAVSLTQAAHVSVKVDGREVKPSATPAAKPDGSLN